MFNRSSGSSQLIADVAGYYLPGTPTATGAFKAVGPTRILDTRNTFSVRADAAVSVQVAGARGVPAGALAAVFNLTVTSPNRSASSPPTRPASLRPNASNLNFAAGQTVPNLVSVPLGSDGRMTLFNRSGGSAQLVADLAGYFLP